MPEVGDRFVVEIFKRLVTLIDYPGIGRIVPKFYLAFLPEPVHLPFRIAYRRDTDRVRIVRVWQSERLL